MHIERWPIIRHIRYFYLRWQVFSFARMCGQIGLGLGWPNQSDLDQLKRIWDGEA